MTASYKARIFEALIQIILAARVTSLCAAEREFWTRFLGNVRKARDMLT